MKEILVLIIQIQTTWIKIQMIQREIFLIHDIEDHATRLPNRKAWHLPLDDLLYLGNQTNPMQDEYLTRCVVDPVKRKFFLYSNEGEERVVDCDTVDQFMAVLELCRDNLDEDTLAYASPLWPKLAFNSKKGRKKIPQIFCPITFLWITIQQSFTRKS